MLVKRRATHYSNPSNMPYLTCIGSHGANRFNLGGYGSRGYWIFRRGSIVVTRWGAVQASREQRYRVFWAQKIQEKIYRCRTPLRAAERVEEMLSELVELGGYSRMPKGVKIGPKRRSDKKARRPG